MKGQKKAKELDALIGIKIAELRSSLGMTKQHLADKLSITQQQLTKYEKGINRITIGRFIEACEYLEVKPSYFFDEEQEAQEVIEARRGTMEIMRAMEGIKDAETITALKKLIKKLSDATI